MNQLPAIGAALATAALIAVGCGDDPVAPSVESAAPLAASAEERDELRLALLFAARSSPASGADGSARIAASFTNLISMVERNDRTAVQRSLDVTRAALQQYREDVGGGNSVDPDLEALSFTLDHVMILATRERLP